MKKVIAKAKAAKQRREAQKELEENPTPMKRVESEAKRIGKVKTIPTDELKNVVMQTVKRVWFDEFGVEIDDANAKEHYAHRIMMILKYGEFDEHGYLKLSGGISMREHEYKRVPLCKEHRG